MRKKHYRRPNTEQRKQPNALIIVAIISAIATIVAAFLNSSFAENWFATNPTAIATATPTITATFTASVLPSFTPTQANTLTKLATSTPTPTLVFTASATPSPESEADEMNAILEANMLEGKAPLKVNFDARASFVQFPGGEISTCGNTQFCHFRFSIFRDSKFVKNIDNDTGGLSYTFSPRGEYIVAVYVCRSNACDDASIAVNVR